MPSPSLTLHELISTIRARRRALGLTQAELARLVGVSERWVNGFEAGHTGVSLDTVLHVIDRLGLTIAFVDPFVDPVATPVDPVATPVAAPREPALPFDQIDLDRIVEHHRQ